MGLITEIGNLLSSGASGGLFGFGASILKGHFKSKWAAAQFDRDLKLKALEREDKEAERAHVRELHQLNAAAAERETEREIKIIEHRGNAEFKNLSMKDQVSLSVNENGSQWSINALRLVRPILTVLYTVFVGLIYVTTDDPVLKSFVVHQIIFLASLTTGWWFGERKVSGNFQIANLGPK